jgi:glycosyltransferase involved in cell wall biosynthesis
VRILMLNNEFPPIGGGTATANLYLLREFAKREIHVDLITSTPERDRFEESTMGKSVRIFRVPIDNRSAHHQTERELLTYMVRAFRQAQLLMRIEPHGAYDLCHAWASAPAGLLALLLRMKRRIPYIVGMRGSDVPGYDVRYRRLYPFITLPIKMIWQQAAATTANSWEVKQLALRTAPRLDIEVIPNGVNLERFRPRGAADSEPHDGKAVEVLCVARLVERKGIDDLLDAVPLVLKRCPNVHMSIVGRGDSEGPLLRQRADLGIDNSVDFVGYVEHSRMPEVYAGADIFVLPSLNEGMPNAVMEAMASGLPIITTYTGGTSELIRGNGIVVPMRAPSAIADAVVELVNNASLRHSMGVRSREIAETLVWDLVADRYLALYQRVVGIS